MDIERLQLRQGEEVTAAHVAALSGAIAQTQIVSGRGVRKRQLPWCQIHHFESDGGTGGTSKTFLPIVTRNKEGFSVGFEFGLIAGIEPSLNGVGISQLDDAGKRPALFIPMEMLEGRADVSVYFRVTFNREWQAEKAEPIASATVPKRVPWTFHKLATIIYLDAREPFRALHWNEGVEPVNRVSDGYAKFLPYPQ